MNDARETGTKLKTAALSYILLNTTCGGPGWRDRTSLSGGLHLPEFPSASLTTQFSAVQASGQIGRRNVRRRAPVEGSDQQRCPFG